MTGIWTCWAGMIVLGVGLGAERRAGAMIGLGTGLLAIGVALLVVALG